MPCYRCGARQADPVRGASPWRRGVRTGAQVLVCPDCQLDPGHTAELDACTGCGSTMLVRALGETHCRACGGSGPPAPAGTAHAAAPHHRTAPGADRTALAQDVAAALDRLFARNRRP